MSVKAKNDAGATISEKSLDLVRMTVLEWFRDDEVTVVLFGSRASSQQHRHSDIDIGVLPGEQFDRSRLSGLLEILSDLNVPYEVELVDLSATSRTFRHKALGEGIIWKS